MKAQKILDKINYVPRWILYVASLPFFPFGTIALYVALHALEHSAKLEQMAEQEQVRYSAQKDIRRGDGYEVRTAGEQETQKRQQAQTRAKKTVKPNYDPIDPEAGVEEVLRQGRDVMRRIRRANDAIPDPALTAKIDSIEESCGQIMTMLEQRPELLPDLRTFLRYYLPTTMKLLDARAQLDDAGTPKGREVRRRIGTALDEIEKAFRNQVAALEEYRFVDLESEMDVLTQMLHSDGLIADDDDEIAGQRGTTASGH